MPSFPGIRTKGVETSYVCQSDLADRHHGGLSQAVRKYAELR